MKPTVSSRVMPWRVLFCTSRMYVRDRGRVVSHALAGLPQQRAATHLTDHSCSVCRNSYCP